MKKFITAKYSVSSEKVKRNAITIAMVSDLHEVTFGEKNERLLEKIRQENPDFILVAGDLVLGKKGCPIKNARIFLEGAKKIAPVYFAPGNHEQRMKKYPDYYGQEYLRFEKKVKQMGVRVLENDTQMLEVKGEKILITGLVLPYHYYDRGTKKAPDLKEMNRILGKSSREHFQILLAHTPKYAKVYFQWGCDLILSGHYHGGMVRVPFLGGVVSPDLRLFPKYCRGMFEKNGSHLIVGAGLGEHTIPMRIFNPRELVVVTCRPGNSV